MDQPHKVKVLEVCRVAPLMSSSQITSLTTTTLPLTSFDLPFLLRSPVELLLFYNLSSSSIQTSHHHLLSQIKHSLSLTLQHFYPLAGNLTWSPESPKPAITYTNSDTVLVTLAESINGDFNHLSSHHAVRDPNQLRPLIPHLFSSPKKSVPLLAIQITLFPYSSGLSFGITTHHVAMDGRAVGLFISSWASICRTKSSNLSQESLPFFDRTTIIKSPINGLEKQYLETLLKFIHSKSMSEHDCNNWLLLSKNITPPKNQVAATFRLSLADLAKLKKWVLERETALALVLVPPPLLMLQQHPSRFELACAYTWICLNKARKKHHDQHGRENNEGEMEPIIFNVDYRGRSDPPVPANYFGNYVVSVRVTAKRSEIVGENGMIIAVRAIRNGIRSGISNTDSIVKNSEHKISRLISNGPERFCAIAGSTQFGFYKLDFGWGKPNKVDFLSIATTGAVFFADSGSEDGGIEISLARSKDEIEAFALAFTNGLNNYLLARSAI